MADFSKLEADIREALAQQHASKSISTAIQTSSREMLIEQARQHFRAVGLMDYLEREVADMKATGYWAKYTPNAVPDRASVSICFIPRKGEQPRVVSHGGHDNLCHLGFQSTGNDLRIYQFGPIDSLRREEQHTLIQLNSALFKAAYESFVDAAIRAMNS
ncbi:MULTISPECIES: hypothetical protein [unclassified Caballeronia]|uniref:hypothetical protein n=1 Tax=unclassified Caballeronia TaxID=2646786 RepID=UPI002856A2E6|nr:MULTISPECIES: hypothetical protein [unclassified Caballeronia]MDR5776984.1 hypothetical protein [Caballeronia sp. LZ002]MDR5852441.1 hypothetical protein [Caballeronia sp. LZ003]